MIFSKGKIIWAAVSIDPWVGGFSLLMIRIIIVSIMSEQVVFVSRLRGRACRAFSYDHSPQTMHIVDPIHESLEDDGALYLSFFHLSLSRSLSLRETERITPELNV